MTAAVLMDDVTAIVRKVRARQISAREVTASALEAVRQYDPVLKCFTGMLGSAIADADAVDRRIFRGEDAGPLAGVPFCCEEPVRRRGNRDVGGFENHAENLRQRVTRPPWNVCVVPELSW